MVQAVIIKEKINLDLLIAIYDHNNSNQLNQIEFEKLIRDVCPFTNNSTVNQNNKQFS